MSWRVLDLFSGIGGFSLGLERAGMKTVAFCEIDPFCRKVLRKHWPDVPIYEDVRTLSADTLRRDGIAVNVICGGFPCQDISVAGKGAGIEGERSGLWSEFARLIGELRPRYAIVENVAAILGRGIERVLGDLAEIGFDAEWHCIPASAVGSPHRRDRWWLVACPHNSEWWAHTASCGPVQRPHSLPQGQESPSRFGAGGQDVAHSKGSGLSVSWTQQIGAYWQQSGGVFTASSWWQSEPDVGRVAHGIPARVDRLRALGNAVVPQIPEIIGKAILAHEGRAA